tara:strand:+ start:102 stop:479 length:378 start_codon:yes stop_codon:yes gene_type:complete
MSFYATKLLKEPINGINDFEKEIEYHYKIQFVKNYSFEELDIQYSYKLIDYIKLIITEEEFQIDYKDSSYLDMITTLSYILPHLKLGNCSFQFLLNLFITEIGKQTLGLLTKEEYNLYKNILNSK